MALVLEFIVSASRICKGPVRASFSGNEAGTGCKDGDGDSGISSLLKSTGCTSHRVPHPHPPHLRTILLLVCWVDGTNSN